jgi:short-subunit dehydrogenase
MLLGPGTVALVTGASRGIGAAIATALAQRGCSLALVARSREELEALAAALPATTGEPHRALPADVGDGEAVAGVVAEAGAVDLLVANAGVAHYGPYRDLDPELEERMTRINWLGTLHYVRAVLPGMLERGRGHIVVVSSGAGLRSFPDAAVYGGTKAAQRGFAEALRHELHGTGVSVTVVYPGEIATHLHDHEHDRMPAWYDSSNARDPAALAEAVVTAVQRDRRSVHHPPLVRVLRIAHGISPVLADLLLRVMRDRSAAPRLDP